MIHWATASVRATFDVRAPDGSEIRTLVALAGGSLVHCRLHPGQVTRAVQHRTVEEVWYCLAGRGQVWRKAVDGGRQDIVDVRPGVALTIPLGTAFQFRATGDQPLDLILTTMPPWPGGSEATAVEGVWVASV